MKTNKETTHELKVLCKAIINQDIPRPLLNAYAHSYLAMSEQDYEDMAHNTNNKLKQQTL
jgi:hypothetical protein